MLESGVIFMWRKVYRRLPLLAVLRTLTGKRFGVIYTGEVNVESRAGGCLKLMLQKQDMVSFIIRAEGSDRANGVGAKETYQLAYYNTMVLCRNGGDFSSKFFGAQQSCAGARGRYGGWLQSTL